MYESNYVFSNQTQTSTMPFNSQSAKKAKAIAVENKKVRLEISKMKAQVIECIHIL